MSHPTSIALERLPRVAIVGRPNVGKSTLFNRLVGRRRAIVTDRPGVTRDRLEEIVTAGVSRFRLVDTGGMSPGDSDALARAVTEQALRAVSEADLIVLVVDVRQGLVPLDREVAGILRVVGRPVILVANKADGPAQESAAAEASELGLGLPVALSAEHGLGIEDLRSAIADILGDAGDRVEGEAADELRVAILGRPNVGKSSLLNRLAGELRVTVSEQAGTTRDSIDVILTRGERRYRLVDTAGMRRSGKLREVAERASVAHAKRAASQAHVVVILLDAEAGITAQDLTVVGVARDSSRPFLLAVNKWDLVDDPEGRAKTWTREIRDRVRFAPWAPVVFVSALTGRRAERVLEVADQVDTAARQRVSTGELNRVLRSAVADGRLPGRGVRTPKIFYATQIADRPPRFVIFADNAKAIHFSFRRYLENRLREAFAFGPTPLVLQFRDRPRRGEGRR